MFNNAWYKAEEFWCLFVFCNLPNFSACPQFVFFSQNAFKSADFSAACKSLKPKTIIRL